MDFLKGVPPEYVNLAILVLTLLVSVAHMRGNKLPILSALLNALTGKPPVLSPPSLPTTVPSTLRCPACLAPLPAHSLAPPTP